MGDMPTEQGIKYAQLVDVNIRIIPPSFPAGGFWEILT